MTSTQVAYTVLITFGFAIIGYFFGSILFASIVARLFKKDVRQLGSGNPGATNVARTIGKKAGFVVSVLDALKGYVVILVCWIIFRYSIYLWSDNTELFVLVYLPGTFAVLGHCFPITYVIKLFKFKFDFRKAAPFIGGKGVSTTGGILFAVSPWLGLISFVIWCILVAIWRYVSLASMVCMSTASAAVFIPHVDYVYLFDNSVLFHTAFTPGLTSAFTITIFFVLLFNSMITIGRHHTNIARLVQHTEKKVFAKKVTVTEPPKENAK